MRIWTSAMVDAGRDGGPGAPLRALIGGLRRRGHALTAFVGGPAPPPASPAPAWAGPDTVFVPRPGLPTPRLRFASQAASFQLGLAPRMLARAARDGPPDVVLARQDAGLGVAVAVGRGLGAAVVSEINGCLRYELAAAGRGPRAVAAAEALERWGYRRSRRIVAVSDGVAEHLVRHLGVDPHRVRVCPNGADVERIGAGDGRALRQRLGFGPKTPVIGYLGGLQRHQGVAELLAAFGRLAEREPAARLLVVGGGEGEADLRRRLAGAPFAPRVTLLGAVPEAEVADCLAAMDVCTAPRLDPFDRDGPGAVGPRGPAAPAGSPLKVFEYLAAGRPVVAGPLPDLRFVEKIGAGLCLDPTDAGSFAHALETLCRDPSLRARMGQAARRWALRHGIWAQAVERVESVLEEAIAS